MSENKEFSLPVGKMEKVVIAFDVDGTLRKNSEERHRTEIEPNPEVVTAFKWIARCKNVELHIWSNRGEEYCRQIRKEFGLEKFVKERNCHLKLWRNQQIDAEGVPFGTQPFVPDICFDDQQRFDGGIFNLIVREK